MHALLAFVGVALVRYTLSPAAAAAIASVAALAVGAPTSTSWWQLAAAALWHVAAMAAGLELASAAVVLGNAVALAARLFAYYCVND